MTMNIRNLIVEFLNNLGQMFVIVYYCQSTVICQQTNMVYLDTDFNLPCSFFLSHFLLGSGGVTFGLH
jgi:hypothetical protein